MFCCQPQTDYFAVQFHATLLHLYYHYHRSTNKLMYPREFLQNITEASLFCISCAKFSRRQCSWNHRDSSNDGVDDDTGSSGSPLDSGWWMLSERYERKRVDKLFGLRSLLRFELVVEIFHRVVSSSTWSCEPIKLRETITELECAQCNFVYFGYLSHISPVARADCAQSFAAHRRIPPAYAAKKMFD